MERLNKILTLFNCSVASTKVITKIGHEALIDLPKNLPKKQHDLFQESLKKSLEKGLEWEKVSETEWRASAALEEVEDLGIANELFYLLRSIPDSGKTKSLILTDFPIHHGIVSVISYFNVFLQDILELIFNLDNRLLKGKSTMTFDELIDLSDKGELIEKMIRYDVGKFEYLSFRKKVEYLKSRVGLSLGIAEQNLANIAYIEQVRHLFVHTGGYISQEFIEKTKGQEKFVGQKITGLDYAYFSSVCDGLRMVADQIAFAIKGKFSK